MVPPTSMSMLTSAYDAHKNFAILLGLNASCNGASYGASSRILTSVTRPLDNGCDCRSSAWRF